MAIRSNMTLNDMTADPLNMMFLYHYKNLLYSIFYHQVCPGTTIGYVSLCYLYGIYILAKGKFIISYQ